MISLEMYDFIDILRLVCEVGKISVFLQVSRQGFLQRPIIAIYLLFFFQSLVSLTLVVEYTGCNEVLLYNIVEDFNA